MHRFSNRTRSALGSGALSLLLALLFTLPAAAGEGADESPYETIPGLSPDGGHRSGSGAPICGPPCAVMGPRNAGTGGHELVASIAAEPVFFYSPGDPVDLTLFNDGGPAYKGYIILAESAPGVPAGEFTTMPPDAQHVFACGGGSPASVTHTLARVTAPRSFDSFIWTAPASDVGPITFSAYPVVTLGEWYGLDEADNSTITWTLTPVNTAVDAPLPGETRLLASRPNPFVSTTRISFEMAEAGPVRVDVLDVSGRIVRSLIDGSRGQGVHSVRWDGKTGGGESAASGVYLVRMEAGNRRFTSKVTVIRSSR